MAGTENAPMPRAVSLDPRTIQWNDRRSVVSFFSSDGGNTEWIEGNFFRTREGTNYWNSPLRGQIPFGWSLCFAHLAQLCPEAIDFAVSPRSPNDWFAEWGGGYYYPDLFARNRPNRWELLAAHARRTWSLMQKTNVRIIGFNVTKLNSADALEAYRVFAAQTDGLLAILAFQYDCYEAGAGETFWVKDRNGVEVPVISARYSIWEHTNRLARSGTPAKVAREIRETVQRARAGELPRFDWVNSTSGPIFVRRPAWTKTLRICRRKTLPRGAVCVAMLRPHGARDGCLRRLRSLAPKSWRGESA
jgi:hypothetical protein